MGTGYAGKLKKFPDEKTEPPKQSLLFCTMVRIVLSKWEKYNGKKSKLI